MRMKKLLFVVFILIIIGIGIAVTYKAPLTTPPSPNETKKITTPHDPVIIAVGDIECDFASNKQNECQQDKTYTVAKSQNPDAVLTLGDMQYESGSLADYKKYYDSSWGKFFAKTYPVPGNHEYATSNAKGYFDYFGDRAGKRGEGYYSIDIGKWHIIALNSNCWAIGGCGKSSPQSQWLLSDLTNHPSKCTLAFWHHPLFSSGQHGNNNMMEDTFEILRTHNADLILNGHDHIYERFAAQDEKGTASPNGMAEFVVGTGGRNLYNYSTIKPNSVIHENTAFGVLKLTLHDVSYDWKFLPAEGNFTDTGSEKCH